MKTYWLPSTDLKACTFHHEEPFERWEWWDAMGEPWGGIACEAEGQLQAVWLLAERKVGPLCFWRMPLAVPYAPLLTPHSLPQPGYAKRTPILQALGNFLRKAEWRLQFIAGSLSPAWSYLPPLYQVSVRPGVTGSFIVETFSPSSALRRKLRQAEVLPVWPMEPARALSFWQANAPRGIRPRLREQLESLVYGPFPWEILAVGEPPQAVSFFLWGHRRVWYYASAHRPDSHPQAGTKLLSTVLTKATQTGKTFDFMGSVLPTIERFFYQFGPTWEHRLLLSTPLLRWLSS